MNFNIFKIIWIYNKYKWLLYIILCDIYFNINYNSKKILNKIYNLKWEQILLQKVKKKWEQ